MESQAGPELSIVVPLYNEAGNVGPLCRAVREALDGPHPDRELVLVDDGSTDDTPLRLRDEARLDPRIRVLRLKRNAGQTQAMAAGFAASRGLIVVSMDGDLQNDPADIPLLVGRVKDGWDVVCGWRKNRQDKWLSRILPSKVANGIIRRITGIPIHDNGCSLKAYRAEVIRSLRLYSEMHRFLPALSSMTGARIDEVVVRHHPRTRGESKYGISRTIKVLGDMFTIKMLTQFGGHPGVWFALLSVPWLLLGLLAAGIWSLELVRSTPTIVFSSLAVMFFYLFGHMMSLSVLSEMILARADRTYMRHLVEVLVVADEIGHVESPGGSHE